MKKFLFVAFAFAAASLSSAGAQTQTYSAKITKKSETTTRRPEPVYSRAPVGAFPRAARGNPIQMLNPRAPRKYYGPPQETVVADDVGPSPGHNRGESINSYTGVILLGFRW